MKSNMGGEVVSQRNLNPKGRLLIFIVAYNAELTIESVVQRIPQQLGDQFDVEILIIDDSSQDNTFVRSELARRAGIAPYEMTVLFNPVNQGYGGNQKIGFYYALENGFDWVALVHGDGQYAPECLPQLIEPLAAGKAEAVFGSRMLENRSALRGGMPFYKYVGNKILTKFQNTLLQSDLSEFHSGYRLYAVEALAKVPFSLNSNDFHFDTEIIIQFLRAGHRIKELPIPTFYGDEICHVNGLQYAANVCLATMQSRVQKYHIFYDRKFDCRAKEDEPRTTLEYLEAAVVESLAPKASLLVLGEIDPIFEETLRAEGHDIVLVSADVILNDEEVNVSGYDYLFVADEVALSLHPEEMVSYLLKICSHTPQIKIIFHAGNIAFILTRVLLLLGRFSYTRKGLVNFKQKRLFTLRSLRKLFVQNGFSICSIQGMPLPYNRFCSWKTFAAVCKNTHTFFAKVWAALFAYQFLLIVQPLPSLPYLLDKAVHVSSTKKDDIDCEECNT